MEGVRDPPGYGLKVGPVWAAAREAERLSGHTVAAGELGPHDTDRNRDRRSMTHVTHAPSSNGRFTGLPVLQHELERSLRAGTELTAVFVDGDPPTGDDWTPVFGNGDTPPPRIAAGLAAQLRATDLIMLLGGQALLCAMPGLAHDDARRRFDEMADGLGTERIRVGIAAPMRGDGASRLVARAQAAAPATGVGSAGPTRLSLRLAADVRSARRVRGALGIFA